MTLWGWPRRATGPVGPARGTGAPQQPGTTGTPAVWAATHRHRKGGLYRLLCYGTNEADRTAVAIYDDASGAIWVRSAAEFDDGRFREL